MKEGLGLPGWAGFGEAWMGAVWKGTNFAEWREKKKLGVLGVSVLAQSFRLKQILWLKLRRLRWLKGCS